MGREKRVNLTRLCFLERYLKEGVGRQGLRWDFHNIRKDSDFSWKEESVDTDDYEKKGFEDGRVDDDAASE